MPRIARLVVMACLLGAMLLPAGVSAQGSPAPARVEVALWPEYDQRAMLVIYRVTLPTGASLPATVNLPIPAHVGDPAAVAQQAADGALILADFVREAGDGDWATLAIQAESAIVQVEFYDPLTIEGQARSYSMVWPAGYPAGELAYEVQQPVGAAAMQIDPAPSSDRVASNGVTYYSGSLGAQDGLSEAQLRIGYTKADSALTAESAPVDSGAETPAIGAPQTGQAPTSLASLVPWLLGGLGVALLVAAAVFYLRTRPRAGEAARRRHRTADREVSPAQVIDASGGFCHACGTRGDAGDTFCRKCGTRLRA